LNLYNETRYIMDKYNIKASKRLGQNFLTDGEAACEIVNYSNISKEDLVIEIGPGLGTLTGMLLEQAEKVVCIELDERMIDILEDRFSMYNNLEIINDDVLKVDLNKLISSKPAKVVANLPYYITSPIIMKLLEDRINLQSITVMVQKEAADRLTAKPGKNNSGAITYGIRYYAQPERIIEVPKTSFFPVPEVDSTVIKLEILNKPAINVKNEKLLFKVIKLAFMQKRKTLANALSSGNTLGDKQDIEKMLLNLGFDTRIRGEKLTLEEFRKDCRLHRNIDKIGFSNV